MKLNRRYLIIITLDAFFVAGFMFGFMFGCRYAASNAANIVEGGFQPADDSHGDEPPSVYNNISGDVTEEAISSDAAGNHGEISGDAAEDTTPPDAAVSEDTEYETGDAAASEDMDAPGDTAAPGIGLVVEDYWTDSDENGLFIAGALTNSGASVFDSVRVAFDLLDEDAAAYASVTARYDERMEPGDSWDFTIYIPRTETGRFKSFRMQSIMGVKR